MKFIRLTILPFAMVSAVAGSALVAAPASGTVASPAIPAADVSEPTGTTASKAGLAVSDAEQEGLERFWTKERMLRATPKRAPTGLSRASADIVADPAGKPGSVPPAAPIGKTAAAWPPKASSAVGKVFFFDPSDGKEHKCSASAVNSPSKQLVVTAAHCVFDAKVYMRRWIFVPAFRNGKMPFGAFAAKEYRTFDSWRASHNRHRDVAMVTMHLRKSRKLVNVVGGNGFTWNRSRYLKHTLIGYGDAHSRGQVQWFFQGRSRPVSQFDPRIEVKHDLGRGASGGPFLLDFQAGPRLGVINGVISQGDDVWQLSPYFDVGMRDIYKDQGSRT